VVITFGVYDVSCLAVLLTIVHFYGCQHSLLYKALY